MDLFAIAENLRAGLSRRYPDRIVTRSLMPVEDRPDDDLAAGVLTVITFRADALARDDGLDAHAGTGHFLITGQVYAGPEAQGEDVENVELDLFREIRAFALDPGAGLCPLDLDSVQFSGQTLAAEGYGWVRCELRYAELD